MRRAGDVCAGRLLAFSAKVCSGIRTPARRLARIEAPPGGLALQPLRCARRRARHLRATTERAKGAASRLLTFEVNARLGVHFSRHWWVMAHLLSGSKTSPLIPTRARASCTRAAVFSAKRQQARCQVTRLLVLRESEEVQPARHVELGATYRRLHSRTVVGGEEWTRRARPWWPARVQRQLFYRQSAAIKTKSL